MKNKIVSLRRQKDFQALISSGKTYSNSSYLFKVLPHKSGIRYGISPSKKHFKTAVLRNKIKRQIRMMLQTTILDKSIDLLIIVKSAYPQNTYAHNLQAFQKLCLTIK